MMIYQYLTQEKSEAISESILVVAALHLVLTKTIDQISEMEIDQLFKQLTSIRWSYYYLYHKELM